MDFTKFISSDNSLSESAMEISAQSIIVVNSFARSSGIVATTIPPALIIPNQQATIIGLFAERIKTRFPDFKPKSSTKTCAIWFAFSNKSL